MVEPAAPSRRGDEAGRRLADHLAEIVVHGVRQYGIFALNPEGRIVSWNPGAESILGYGEEEIIGRPYATLLEPGDPDPASILEGVVERGRREAEEWRVRRDGSRIWAYELITALRDETDHLVAFAVLLGDRTDQKLADEARLRSERMLAGIVSTTADAIVTVDESQRICLFNPAAEVIFGHRAEEAIGQPLDLLIPEPHREPHRLHVREFLASPEKSRRMDERGGAGLFGLRSNGQVFPIEASISKTRVGEAWQLTAVVRDVSERVREASARELLVRAAVILDSSLDSPTTLREVARLAIPEWADWCIVYLQDEDGMIRRIRVAHGNPELEGIVERLQSYSVLPEEEHPVRGVITGGEPLLMAEFPESLLEAVARDEEHLRILRRLGLRSAVIAPLLARGRSLGAIGLFSAAPARRYDDFDLWLAGEIGRRAGLAIDNARLYGEAQAAIRARDEVVSVVSHDLRNPLNSILMSAQMLDELLEAQGLPEAARKLTGVLTRSAERMNRMIQDLLDISRLESGRFQLETQPLDPAPLLAEAHEMFLPLAREQNLALELRAEAGLPAVAADPDRLHQVLSNLVGNALKFTPSGGRVTVGASPAADAVVFSVADTGIGIGQEQLPHLFDRFWQAQRSDRRGVGLGLPIVKGIVVAHGGEVRVESEEGVGTTFSFSIPRTDR